MVRGAERCIVFVRWDVMKAVYDHGWKIGGEKQSAPICKKRNAQMI